ncbi:hypothetical protein, partial [Pseudomonas sp. GM74]|uniref:hypothetical protein n=1 Tax=Pseudomonas sp. GM74 TaxID=1144336 RepID=UPI001EE677EE
CGSGVFLCTVPTIESASYTDFAFTNDQMWEPARDGGMSGEDTQYARNKEKSRWVAAQPGKPSMI